MRADGTLPPTAKGLEVVAIRAIAISGELHEHRNRCFSPRHLSVKVLGFILAAVALVGAILYLAIFHNPQSEQQQAMNAAWDEFAVEVAELGEAITSAPFNQDEQTAAEGYRHMARLLASFLGTFTDYRDPNYPQFSRFPNTVARMRSPLHARATQSCPWPILFRPRREGALS